MNHDITIQDVFHRFLPQYCETHNFSPQQQLTALCISKCHTLEMGANLSECENCHKKYIHYNSCKNRHCPMCQGMEVDEWIDKQQVRRIIEEFRAGTLDKVPVWMDKNGRTMLVTYMAVRDKSGKYLGTMELVQDMEFAKEYFQK